MIKWLLRRGARTFGKTYDYDVSYMLDVINTSTGAGARLSAFPLISQYRGPKAAAQIWMGAIFASTLEGDCGPCAQLVVDMAQAAGADTMDLKRCFDGDPEQAGDIGLGFRFAMAAIHGHLDVDDLQAEIETRYGRQAVVAASFAAATGRFYPVFKRGLGYGHACHQLVFDGKQELALAPS
ncbi:MAG: hypothetical protein AAGA89_10700 [Pseudomonadota bacterium]